MCVEPYQSLFIVYADDTFFYSINMVNYISREHTLRNHFILGRSPSGSWSMSAVGFCLLVFYLGFLPGESQVKERRVCIFFYVVFFSFMKIHASFPPFFFEESILTLFFFSPLLAS